MIDAKTINDMVQKVMSQLPPGLKNIPDEAQENVRAAMQSMFNKLDLVTREEFDAQAGVLLKTRKKLEALEKKIKDLEQGSS